MKKALLTLIVMSVSVSVFAQGIVVFQNIASGKPAQWDADNNGVGDRSLSSADGVQLSLWYQNASSGNRWEMLGNPVSIAGTGGLFAGGNRTVPNAVEGTPYTFAVRAWETAIYGTAATAWDTASVTPGAKVTLEPLVFTSATGGFGTTPPLNLATVFAGLPNITVGTVVPEPSVFALGVLGVGALLMLRRRK